MSTKQSSPASCNFRGPDAEFRCRNSGRMLPTGGPRKLLTLINIPNMLCRYSLSTLFNSRFPQFDHTVKLTGLILWVSSVIYVQ